MICARPHLQSLTPYGLGILSPGDDGPQPVSLAQNESAVPPSPSAIEAAIIAARSASVYSDADWTGLRRALSDVYDLDPAAILCGAGSMELIALIMHAFAGPGTQVLSTEYAYAFFRTAAEISGAEYVSVSEQEMMVSVDAVLDGVTSATRVVSIANPGNPSGTRIASSEVRRLRDGLSGDILLVIDEAYGEFSDDLDGRLFDLIERGDTVVLRTLSKAYGLAGMRVGWGTFPLDIASEVRKIQSPGSVSAASLAAAEAAVRDQVYMQNTVRETRRLRNGFLQQLPKDGIRVWQSFTNFVLLEFESQAAAQSADKALRTGGLVMRGMPGYGLPQCLRATIAAEAYMARAAAVLRDWSERSRA